MAKEVPKFVDDALDLAVRLEFDYNCLKPVGQLLQVLVASAGAGSIGEIGTGCGVGAAWMLSTLRGDQAFISIDSDVMKAHEVTTLMGHVERTHFIEGDWHEILNHAPFQLLFVDVSDAKDAGCDEVVDALQFGGIVLLDDFSPFQHFQAHTGLAVDERRERWLSHPKLLATEILTSKTTSVILGTRK